MAEDRAGSSDGERSGARRTLVSGEAAPDVQTVRGDPRGDATAVPGATVTVQDERPVGAGAPASRFDDRGEIARGGMSTVRRVYDRLLCRTAAMKVLDTTEDERARLRFVEEAQIGAQLDHPNMVPVYDLGVDEEGAPAFFTMKLVQGRTLAQEVAALGEARLSGRPLERLLRVFLKVCDAVAFAHSRGVVHRDLKPENVMIGSHGQVYVMDWGVARLDDERDSDHVASVRVSRPPAQAIDGTGAIVGTPAYMAPEQAQGRVEETDARTDVYGLGGLLYFLLSERSPRHGLSLVDTFDMALRGEIRPLEANAGQPKLPPGLRRIALKALSKKRVDRYAAVEALARDVEDFLLGGGWFDVVTAQAGTPIVKEGDPADAAYIIVEGTCEAWKSIDGQRVTLRSMVAGEVFGETALLTGEPRTASVSATDDVTLAVVTRESLDHELSRSAWLGSLVRALAVRFADLDAQLTRLRKER